MNANAKALLDTRNAVIDILNADAEITAILKGGIHKHDFICMGVGQYPAISVMITEELPTGSENSAQIENRYGLKCRVFNRDLDNEKNIDDLYILCGAIKTALIDNYRLNDTAKLNVWENTRYGWMENPMTKKAFLHFGDVFFNPNVIINRYK